MDAAKTVCRASGEGAANPALRRTSIVKKLGRMACKPGQKRDQIICKSHMLCRPYCASTPVYTSVPRPPLRLLWYSGAAEVVQRCK